MTENETTLTELENKNQLLDTDCIAIDDGVNTYKVTGAQLREFLKVNYLPLGTIVYSQSNRMADNPGRLPLWTGLYIENAAQSYQYFYNWVKARPEICCTKEEYDTLLAENNQINKYVLDEVSGSLRMPVYRRFIKAVGEDGLREMGLDQIVNITGNIPTGARFLDAEGVFEFASYGEQDGDTSGTAGKVFKFDASKVVRIGAEVQPRYAAEYPWVCSHNYAIPAAMADNAALLELVYSSGDGQGVLDLGTPTQDIQLSSNFNYTITAAQNVKMLLPPKADIEHAKLNSINLFIKIPFSMRLSFGQKIATQNGADVWEVTPGSYLYSFLFDNLINRWTVSVKHQVDEPNRLVLLCRFNGDLSDDSAAPLTLTPNVTNQYFPKFMPGKYSNTQALRGYSQQYLKIEAGGDKLNIGTEDFTISFWYFAENINPILMRNADKTKSLGVNSITGFGTNFYGSFAFSVGNWYHIMFTRRDGNILYFVDGILKGGGVNNSALTLNEMTILFYTDATRQPLLQELVIKKGVADFTSDFTPPIAPYIIEEE